MQKLVESVNCEDASVNCAGVLRPVVMVAGGPAA
jgi:hypothetical protein